MMPWNWGWGTAGMMPGGLGMLAFWGLLIALAVWGARALGSGTGRSMPPSGPASGAPPTPMEIAQARCVRGEISRDEFETIRRDLQGSAYGFFSRGQLSVFHGAWAVNKEENRNAQSNLDTRRRPADGYGRGRLRTGIHSAYCARANYARRNGERNRLG